MKTGEKLRQLWHDPKKRAALLAAGLALLLLCGTVTFFAVRRHRANEALLSELTATVPTAVPTTIPTTAAPTTLPTTTEAPKPVGTTRAETLAETKPPKREKPKQTANVLLDVPFIDQRAKYPTGCESVSAVMVMRYYGMDISPEYFIDHLLAKGGTPVKDSSGTYFGDDPRKVFLGSPYSEAGWGCYAPVIVDAVNKYIDHDKFEVKAVYNQSPDALCRQYIDKGVPVLFWATADMAPSYVGKTWYISGTSETFTWTGPMHCLVLVGYNSSGYFFNDPLQSKSFYYAKSKVTKAYNALGRQAVVLQKAVPKPTEPSTVEQTVEQTTLPVSTTEQTTQPASTAASTTEAATTLA